MKKISLLITYDFPPIPSGIATVFYNVWKMFSPQNHLILAPRIKGYKKIDSATGFKIYRYFPFGRMRIMRIVLLYVYTLVLVIREKIDVLICGVPLSIGVIGLTFKKIWGMPYCVFYYGGEFNKYRKRKIMFAFLKIIIKNADCVITNSTFSSREVSKYGVKEDKIHKITPGVDLDKFKPDLECADIKKNLKLDDKKVLLTVSRLVRRKGIDTVIEALPIIIKEFPNIRYLVVGKGEESEDLKKFAKSKGVENNVVFVGYVPDDELPKYYNTCDIFLMPNRETVGEETVEGFGISFIEASACGKPVIGGASGGTKDAVINGETGFLIDPENIQEMANLIGRLLKDGNYAATIGNNGRKRAEQEFGWQLRAQRIEKFLEKVSQGKEE